MQIATQDFSHWTPRPRPERVTLTGRTVSLVPLDADKHALSQWEAHRTDDRQGEQWRYLPYGPFPSYEAYAAHLAEQARSEDYIFFAVVVDGTALGVMSLMTIVPEHGSIELGHVCLTSALSRTTPATEAFRLIAGYVFDRLRYRRLEWKTDALNAGSRRSALRFGFTFEGVLRQHRIVKGRSRDTAYFGLTDGDWPVIRAALDSWLDVSNFDRAGEQRTPLGLALTRSGSIRDAAQ